MGTRILISVIIGGILGPMLRPQAGGRFRVESLADLSSPFCSFLDVTTAEIFAAIFVLVFAACCPMNTPPVQNESDDAIPIREPEP